MDKKRLLLVGIAVFAGLLAAYLALNPGEPPRPQVARPVPTRPAEGNVDILVATRQLPPGSELSPGSLKWLSFPSGRVPAGAVTRKAEPNALTEMQGHLASHQIENGEPVTHAKVQKRADGGLLATLIAPGMRAVSIPLDIKNVRAVGGFIFPNDRVDVVVTLPAKQNANVAHGATPSRILLQNIRVLAMGQNLAQTQLMGQKISLADVATLEVTPEQANNLLTAMREAGAETSLVLRPVGEVLQKDEQPGPGKLLTIRYGRISKD